MKYLKTYENSTDYTHVVEYEDLKKGDYVIITSSDIGFKNKLMVLDKHPELFKFLKHFCVSVHNPLKEEESYMFFDYEIVKKLTKSEVKEVELSIAAQKYNL